MSKNSANMKNIENDDSKIVFEAVQNDEID